MFDKDFLNILFNTNPIVDWDKNGYKFNRVEKDMHPYSIIRKDNQIVITHNVLGLNKEDLIVTREKENGDLYIKIEGKTIDDITGKEYSISSKFLLDESQLDISKISSTMKNGLLYIVIAMKQPEPEMLEENTSIEIL